MAETQKEQYSVLTWVWHVAKLYDEGEEDAIQQFRDHIGKTLRNIAKSGAIDFDKLLSELKRGLY